MATIEELNKKCNEIIPSVRKKSEFNKVIAFWNNNRDDFNSLMRERRRDQDSGIFLFVKEYSSLLLYFLISGNEYPGDIKSDLEDLYGGFLKNMSFGGRYIIDSYLKLYNFNNIDQLHKDGEYIADNIKNAKELGVLDQTISTLCKDYLNKCIIYGVINSALTHEFWTFLSSDDRKYFTTITTTTQPKGTTQFTPKHRTIEEEIEIFNKIVSGEELPEEDTNEIIGDEEVVEDVTNDDIQESEVIEGTQEIEESGDEEVIQEEVEEVQPEKVEEKGTIEESAEALEETEEELEKGFRIAVVSSETQMMNIRRAFSQDWLNAQEKERGWPHINFSKDVWMIDGFKDAPKTSIRKVAKYSMIIIGQNDHLFKDMPKEYTAGQKKDGGIKKCLQEVYGLGDGRVYFPEKNKMPDLSVSRLRACLNDYMSRKTQDIPVL